MPDRPTSTSLPRSLDGRYVLHGQLGRGGMASVHRATDEVLGRDVAVKVLHGHLADDPAFLDRFRREARAAAALSHPNLVAVHDWGDTDDGPYMVMELVDGMSLREVLRLRGRVGPQEALALLGPAAAGLSAVHRAGLVHRDVKPENVLLGHDGTVKITDFGLARVAAGSTATFGADVLVGSPHYLSPEAVAGHPLDARSDVYGLGIVLYECLTGRPPFQADSPLATAMQHTQDVVPRPSSVVPAIPPAVDAVVRTATSADPDARYPDAAAFALALAAAVPEGPAVVDLRDGERDTVVLATEARDTLVGLGHDPDAATRVTARSSRPRRRRLRRLLPVLVLLALGLGSFLLWDQVLAPVTPIPAVAGEPADAARAALESAGFTVRIAPDEAHSLEVPAGAVLSARPDDEARRGSTVTLVLSAGPRTHDLPNVAGEEEAAAVAALEELGLLTEVVRRHDEQVPAGLVIGTDPAAGTVVEEASTVEVVVSDGPAPIEVVDVRGEPEGEARTTLEELGLAVEIAERPYDDAPEGTVLTMSPAPGEVLHRGDTVSLTVSAGPKPFAMPDVRGESEERARAVLEQRGLVVRVRYVDTVFFFREGEVDEQDPTPGSQVRKGDEVTIYVWR